MRLTVKHICGALVTCAAIISAGMWFSGSDKGDAKPAGKVLRSRKIGSQMPRDDRSRRRSQRVPLSHKVNAGTYGDGAERVRVLEFNEKDERELNDAARDLIAALRRALDRKDFSEVLRLAKFLQQSPPQKTVGLSRLPTALKRRLIEALGYCGAEAVPEIVSYLTDSDPEIVEDAFDEFRKMLRDYRLGDRDRAVIVTAASKVLTDTHSLNVMLSELNTMRHSVFVNTVLEINERGTSEAQELLGHSVEFYTGKKDLVTEDALLEWLESHPDGARDEAFYGGWGK